MMYFVIEESSFGQNLSRAAYIESLELWLDRLDVAHERDEGVCASSSLLEQLVFGVPLADFLWGGELPRHVQERITVHFGRMQYWDDVHDWSSIEACIEAIGPVDSPSAAYVRERVDEGELMACLPLPGVFEGVLPVSAVDKTALVHFVVDEATHRGFFRAGVEAQKLNVSAVAEIAPHAYPDTHFVEGVWSEVRRFEGGYARVREDLLRFLACFDDHARWIFTDASGRLSQGEAVREGEVAPVTRELIQRRFRGHGFEVAPEQAEVARHRLCREARERDVRGRVLYCEWHWKIEPHTNRVHVHEPVEESDGRAIVAIFAQHLLLPGDS